MSYLKDLPKDEIKRITKEFINGLILDLRVSLSKEEIEHIYNRLIVVLSEGAIPEGTLGNIRKEILNNYKKYIPFCYASIKTAWNNIAI
jgi:hypothetical protein